MQTKRFIRKSGLPSVKRIAKQKTHISIMYNWRAILYTLDYGENIEHYKLNSNHTNSSILHSLNCLKTLNALTTYLFHSNKKASSYDYVTPKHNGSICNIKELF